MYDEFASFDSEPEFASGGDGRWISWNESAIGKQYVGTIKAIKTKKDSFDGGPLQERATLHLSNALCRDVSTKEVATCGDVSMNAVTMLLNALNQGNYTVGERVGVEYMGEEQVKNKRKFYKKIRLVRITAPAPKSEAEPSPVDLTESTGGVTSLYTPGTGTQAPW